jgi:hypothetical protein
MYIYIYIYILHNGSLAHIYSAPTPVSPSQMSFTANQNSNHPQASIVNHRNDKAAEKLATALAAKYLFELNPSRSHKSNVHALLSRELHDLTRQALAFRTARLPPRVLCRLNAFIANLCAAVPESPLPASITRFSSASARRASEGVEGICLYIFLLLKKTVVCCFYVCTHTLLS